MALEEVGVLPTPLEILLLVLEDTLCSTAVVVVVRPNLSAFN